MRSVKRWTVFVALTAASVPAALGEPVSLQSSQAVLSQVAEIEDAFTADLGLFVTDVDSGEVIEHGADDRFPLNSTFKVFACAALLSRVDAGTSTLDASVALDEKKLISWSPSVERLLTEGRKEATLRELCAAMLAVSDNTAANLVLKEIGGPKGFTAYMRSIGDTVTR